MPQLMPLFWILSNMYILFFLLVLIFMYSFSFMNLSGKSFGSSKVDYSWYW